MGHCDYMNFNFKWVDSDSRITTMEQFYTEGDVAPLGRMNYVFNTVLPGTTPPAEEETGTPDESTGDVTEETAPGETTGDSASEPQTGKKGCGASLSAAALLTAAAAGVSLTKKKENE